MSNQKKVTALPPTLGIKDPDVKMFLDALTNAWDQRSGNTNPDDGQRFITKEEFYGLATKATIDFFSGGIPGSEGGGAGGQGSVAEIIGMLSDQIKKTYLYQLLGTEFEYVDIKAMNERLNAAIADAKTGFKQERIQRESSTEALTQQIDVQAARIDNSVAMITTESTTRASNDQALATQISTQATRVDNNIAAIQTEQTTRSAKDNALASAINSIWASVGGSGAVIEDGVLAAITPSAAQATKWNQVQAEVIDPNTGVGKVTAVRQDMTSYINQTDGTLRSVWSVRAEATSSGRTVVGGFGLALTESGGAGPTIDFGVRADRFWIGNTSGEGDLPFIVSGGQTFIKSAMIQNAAIDSAKIQDLAVGTAKIQNASVGTLKIASGSVTSMQYAEGGAGSVGAGGQAVACQVWIDMPAGSTGVVVTVTVAVIPVGGDNATTEVLITGNSGFARSVGVSLRDGFYQSITLSGFDPNPVTGINNYVLWVRSPTSGPGSNQPLQFAQPSITATGGKR